MKVKILKGTVAGGRKRKVGASVDVTNAEGRYLVAIGKAEPVEEKEVKK